MTGHGADAAVSADSHRSLAATARSVLADSFRQRSSQLWRLAAWSALEALPAVLSGVLVARAVDDGFLAGSLSTGFSLLGLLAVSVVLGAWGTRQTLRRLAAVVEPFRDDLVTGVVTGALYRATQPGAGSGSGDIARLTQQVEIAREAYAAVLVAVQQFVVVTVGAVIGLVALAPAVLLLVLPPVALALGIFSFALLRMATQQRASIMADERMAETAATVGAGLRDIAACGGHELAHASVGAHIDAARAATTKVSRLAAVATIAVAVGGWIPLILILAFAPWLLDQGASTGVLLGAAAYVLQGLQPALQTLVNGLSGPGLWLMVTLRRIVETGGAGAQPPQATVSHHHSHEKDGWVPVRYELTLEDVTFAYGERAEPVIRELDLTIAEGDHLAIVGPSGAGKSTLAGVMTGLLEPQAGQVSIGGRGLLGQSARELAGRRVLIPQEAYVFAGTLRENLSYLRADASYASANHADGAELDGAEHDGAEVGGAELSDAELSDAELSDAELDDAVRRLGAAPLVARLGGYAAELDTSTLSAGERQLITLVRAYLATASVVILDEATCHLDPAAEAQVERAFAERAGTLVVIAHRISSALRARRILVLDGVQATVGEHDELLAQSRLYRDLVGHWQVPVEAARPR